MNNDDIRPRRKPRPNASRGMDLVALEHLANEGDSSVWPKTLNPSQYEFCLHYLANGFNATAAYQHAQASMLRAVEPRLDGPLPGGSCSPSQSVDRVIGPC